MTGGKTCITGRSTRTCPLDFEKNDVKSIAF